MSVSSYTVILDPLSKNSFDITARYERRVPLLLGSLLWPFQFKLRSLDLRRSGEIDRMQPMAAARSVSLHAIGCSLIQLESREETTIGGELLTFVASMLLRIRRALAAGPFSSLTICCPTLLPFTWRRRATESASTSCNGEISSVDDLHLNSSDDGTATTWYWRNSLSETGRHQLSGWKIEPLPRPGKQAFVPPPIFPATQSSNSAESHPSVAPKRVRMLGSCGTTLPLICWDSTDSTFSS